MRRKCIAVARYVNRYGHIPDVSIGGWAAVRAMNYGRVRGEYYHVRRHQAHGFGKGYERGEQWRK